MRGQHRHAARPAARLHHRAQRGQHLRRHAGLPPRLRSDRAHRGHPRAQRHLQRHHPLHRNGAVLRLSVGGGGADHLRQHAHQLERARALVALAARARRLHPPARAALGAQRLLPLLRSRPRHWLRRRDQLHAAARPRQRARRREPRARLEHRPRDPRAPRRRAGPRRVRIAAQPPRLSHRARHGRRHDPGRGDRSALRQPARG